MYLLLSNDSLSTHYVLSLGGNHGQGTGLPYLHIAHVFKAPNSGIICISQPLQHSHGLDETLPNRSVDPAMGIFLHY